MNQVQHYLGMRSAKGPASVDCMELLFPYVPSTSIIEHVPNNLFYLPAPSFSDFGPHISLEPPSAGVLSRSSNVPKYGDIVNNRLPSLL